MTAVSGGLLVSAFLVGTFFSFGAAMEAASRTEGTPTSQTALILSVSGAVLLIAWAGVLVGLIGIAATNRRARFGAFVGAAVWVIVTLFVSALAL